MNFALFGVLILVFQAGVQQVVAPGWSSLHTLAMAIGLGMVLIAVFPTDRAGIWMIHGATHLGVVAALAILLPLSCVAGGVTMSPGIRDGGVKRCSVR